MKLCTSSVTFTFCVLATIVGNSIASPAAAGEPAAKGSTPKKVPLEVGGELPFLVVDFVTGMHKAHCGCPSVMLKNRKSRGLVIWSKGWNDDAATLAAAVDQQLTDERSKQGFLVLFDTEEELARAAFTKSPLKHVHAGHARDRSDLKLRNLEMDKAASLWIFLVDQKEVQGLWSLKANELTKEKRREILAATENLFATK